MSSLMVFVGLDYHSDWIQVCVLTREGRQLANRRVNNDVMDVVEFIEKHGLPAVVALEACARHSDLRDHGARRHFLGCAVGGRRSGAGHDASRRR